MEIADVPLGEDLHETREHPGRASAQAPVGEHPFGGLGHRTLASAYSATEQVAEAAAASGCLVQASGTMERGVGKAVDAVESGVEVRWSIG
jgi:hypothetical protein